MRLGREKLVIVLFLLIPLLVYTAFRLFLIPYAVYISTTNMSFLGPRARNWGFTGLENYKRLVSDPNFWESCKNSLIYAVVCGLLGQFWLGFFLAMIIWDGKLRGGIRGKLTTLLMGVAIVSWILPETIAGFEWLAIYNKYYGILNKMLGTLGLGPIEWLKMRGGWLGIPLALWSLTLANIWKGSSFSMVMFSSAMEGIPREIYDAAKIDGVNKFQEFVYITLPLLRHMMPFVLLILFTGSFSHFAFVWIIMGQIWHEANIGIYSWAVAFRKFEIGYGAAIAVVVAIIYLIFGIAQRRLGGEAELVTEK